MTHGLKTLSFFTGRMEPRALARVTLVATALLTGATVFWGKHKLVTASTRAFRRAAAKPTTRTAAHTMPDRLHNNQNLHICHTTLTPQIDANLTALAHTHHMAPHASPGRAGDPAPTRIGLQQPHLDLWRHMLQASAMPRSLHTATRHTPTRDHTNPYSNAHTSPLPTP